MCICVLMCIENTVSQSSENGAQKTIATGYNGKNLWFSRRLVAVITGIVNLFYVFFPASLFGVLVFGPVSRPPPPPPPPPRFVTHTTLSNTIFHTTLSNTIFHTQLCQTQSFTHNLSHTQSFKHLLSLSSLPVPLQLLFLLIGRSWLVGLSSSLVLVNLNAHAPTSGSCPCTVAACPMSGGPWHQNIRSQGVDIWLLLVMWYTLH